MQEGRDRQAIRRRWGIPKVIGLCGCMMLFGRPRDRSRAVYGVCFTAPSSIQPLQCSRQTPREVRESLSVCCPTRAFRRSLSPMAVSAGRRTRQTSPIRSLSTVTAGRSGVRCALDWLRPAGRFFPDGRRRNLSARPGAYSSGIPDYLRPCGVATGAGDLCHVCAYRPKSSNSDN
jgi:hypothetical protein